MDILLLNLYLGAIVFFTGIMALVSTTKNIIKNRLKVTLLVIFQFIVSFLLSLIVWHYWIFDFDIMLGFISLPAVIAEIITISIIYLTITKGKK